VGERIASRGSRRVVTIPNALSAIRIALIPAFVLLLAGDGTRLAGFVLMGLVVATDWVDGYVARRMGQVTELGKLLDPLADRLVLAAGLITFVALDMFPLWGALVILARDVLVLGAAVWLAVTHGPLLEVRPIGKFATFTLMWGIPLVAWGNAGLPLDDLTLVLGWVWFPIGTVEYYAAAVAYAVDLRRSLSRRA
jgi:cardiolipin synthase (CMP-forming)